MSESEGTSWHWADADGVVSIVDEWELVSSLSTGSLPHYTLVWREGWKVWLPACQVAELASTLPRDRVEKAVDPGVDPLLKDPPPPPVDRYQAFQAREAAAKLLGKAGKTGTRASAAPPGLVGAAPPPPPPPRPAQPTLIDGTPATSTATLRPPGAVPPPPRGVPAPAPVLAIAPAATAPAVLAPPTPIIHEEPAADPAPMSAEPPTQPRAVVEPPGVPPLPSWSDDLDAELRAGARPRPVTPSPHAPPAPAGPAPARAPTGSRSLVGLVVVGASTVGVIALAAAVALYLRSTRREAPPPATATSAPSARSGHLLPCKLDRKAARLAPTVLASVVPGVATVGDRFAVGFAASEKEAEGITVDASSLSVDRPFRKKLDQEISGVVPLGGAGEIGFLVDHDDRGFRSARTLDPKTRLAIGWSDQGLARRTGDGAPVTIWPMATDKVTDPRAAPLPGGGYAVTARRGGMGGSVLVGLLDANGNGTTDFSEVASKSQVGTPAIGASDAGVLVAFAARPTEDSYWTLQVATAGPGGTPKSAQGFATPPGGPGADAISPAIAGLSGGRWLLQWTEGAAGRRQVRVQTLGSDLVPVGDPVTLSPEESNAGQGVVMVRGDKALSLFMVARGKTHELWGATLTCP